MFISLPPPLAPFPVLGAHKDKKKTTILILVAELDYPVLKKLGDPGNKT